MMNLALNDLKARLQDKDKTIYKLKDTIKYLRDNTKEENVNHDKWEIEPINKELENSVAKLLSENEHLCNEINHVKQEIVEQAKVKQPLDGKLDLACKYNTRIQELLVYVQDTCPNAIIPNTRKVAVTPMNNVKKVRFAKPLTSSSNSKQVESSNTSDSNTPVLSSTGVKCSTRNCRSKPPGNKKNDRISQTPSRNKKNKVEAQPRKVNNSNRVVKPVCDVDVKHSLSNTNSEILCATCNKSMFDGVHDKCLLDLVVQIVLWYLDSGCSKHITGNRSQLINFVSKFLGTVRFRNDQIARIMGHGDYQLGNVIISRVYYVEGLGHNLFSVGQFCDADLEVAFRKNTCFIRNLEGVDLLLGSRDTNLYIISLDDMLKSSLICLLSKASKTKSWLWHHRLSHLNFVIVDDYSRFTWVRFLKTKDEAPADIIKCIKNIQVCLKATVWNVRTDNGTEFVNQTLRECYNTACYTQNHSLIRLRYNKTPYELMQDKKPDLSFFHVFGSLCYPTNDNDDLGKFDAKAYIVIFVGYAPAKRTFRIYNRRTQIITENIHVTFDELTTMASEQFSLGPGLQGMTPATSSTGLGSNPVSQQPCLPPIKYDWDRLFQPMFDEYFNPSPIDVSLVQEAAAPRAAVLVDSPVSTSID
ncbi:retrovirus-related pol polyprotein from transposon TNT 1-94 [Tanacetum coccineum]